MRRNLAERKRRVFGKGNQVNTGKLLKDFTGGREGRKKSAENQWMSFWTISDKFYRHTRCARGEGGEEASRKGSEFLGLFRGKKN